MFNLNFVLEVEDALSGDNEKPFDIPNYLFVKCEDVPLVNSPGISAPCKFEYNTQELEPKCSDNQGTSQAFGFCRIKNIG